MILSGNFANCQSSEIAGSSFLDSLFALKVLFH